MEAVHEGQHNKASPYEVNVPGIDKEILVEVEERLNQFEKIYDEETGEGWVPVIRKIDFITVAVFNFIILLWWLFAFLN